MMLKIHHAELCITGINYILKYIPIEISCFKLKNILQYYCIFDQTNAVLISRRDQKVIIFPNI